MGFEQIEVPATNQEERSYEKAPCHCCCCRYGVLPVRILQQYFYWLGERRFEGIFGSKRKWQKCVGDVEPFKLFERQRHVKQYGIIGCVDPHGH